MSLLRLFKAKSSVLIDFFILLLEITVVLVLFELSSLYKLLVSGVSFNGNTYWPALVSVISNSKLFQQKKEY